MLDFATLLPYAVFGLFATGAWFLLDMLGNSPSRTMARLDEFKNPQIRKKRLEEDSAIKQEDAMTRVLAKATPALAKSLTPKTELEMNQLKLKMSMAGFRGDTAVTTFLGLKFVGLIGGFMLSGTTVAMLQSYDFNSIMYAVGFAGVMFYLPEIALAFITSSRKEQVFLGLPDALDLLVVCVEAGLGMDSALRKVSEEMKRTFKVIAEEFQLANFQIQMGRPRSEVWHELGIRTGVEDLRQLSSIIIQAEKFGSSIAQALRVQSDAMRTRRKQIAEEKAAKTAVKLIFPLVIFIFPGIFVVLVGPAAITMVREMFPMMGG